MISRFEELENRLEALLTRLERLERLALASYSDVRKVADYAYTNVRLEVGAEEVKRLTGMRDIQDREVLAAGLAPADLALIKLMLVRIFRFQARHDVLGIAASLSAAQEVAAEAKKAA